MATTASTTLASATDAAAYRYDRAQRLFHWTMAAIILAAIGLGVWSAYLPPGTSPRRELLDLHKSLGTTAAVLVVFRIAYRMVAGEPPYRRPLAPPIHLAARAGHLGLYGLMILMPATGYVYSAAGGFSLPWFGLFTWPRLVPLDKALSRQGYELHYVGAWLIAGFLAAHIGAVIWHHWILRDEVASRMIPQVSPGP